MENVMKQTGISAVETERTGQVGTIRLLTFEQWLRKVGITVDDVADLDRWWEIHPDLSAALEQFQDDEEVRVIVITGAEDGMFLSVLGHPDDWIDGEPGGFGWMTAAWAERGFAGALRHTRLMVEMEKPIIARGNGDALGIGQSILFACDFIVMWADAIIADLHMGLEDWPGYVAPKTFQDGDRVHGFPPGDGGAALVPTYLTPAKAKEYLMLAKPYRASEFAELGIVNYAVAPDELDEKVDDITQRLLRRSATSLAFTKRAVNRNVAGHVNLTADAAGAYQWVEMYRLGLLG